MTASRPEGATISVEQRLMEVRGCGRQWDARCRSRKMTSAIAANYRALYGEVFEVYVLVCVRPLGHAGRCRVAESWFRLVEKFNGGRLAG